MKNVVKTMGFMMLALVAVIGVNVIFNIMGKELEAATFAVSASMLVTAIYRMTSKKEIAA